MVVFLEDGQGVWDFDFELLARNTSIEFAEEVKATMESEYVVNAYEVNEYGDGDLVEVVYMTNLTFVTLTYSKERKYISREHMLISVVKRFLDGGR